MTPDKYTISEKFLNVSKIHNLYVQDWGNKSSKNVFVFLHGGPGSGTSDSAKGFFDPRVSRVIFFDQRGSGKSLPRDEIRENTISDLADDIEKIADEFNIEMFTLVGRSWGSCLALFFAIKHPNRVKNLVIGGVFTGSKSDSDLFDSGAFKIQFPDIWEEYQATAPKEFRENPSAYHFSKIGAKEKISETIYANLEGSLSIINAEKTDLKAPIPEEYLFGQKIEMHYLKNNCFLPDEFILENSRKIKVPVHIIQGRYDMICPPTIAYKLSKKLVNANLIWTIAGHSSKDGENSLATKLVIKQLCSES